MMPAAQTFLRLVLVGGAVAAVLLADSSGLLPPRSALALDDGAQAAAGVFACVCCASAARRVGGVEQSWRILMALGMAGWTVGQLLWSWYQVVDGVLLPPPSPADIGYLSMPVFAAAALLVIARDTRRRARPRQSVAPGWLVLLLDGLVVVGSLLILTWVTALGAVVRAGATSTLSFVVAVAYPVTDLVLVTMVVLLLSTQPAPLRLRPQLVLLGLGLTGLAVSDSIFTYLVAGGATSMSAISDAGYIAGPLLIGVAALTTAPVPQRSSASAPGGALPGTPWAHLLLPYVPLALVGVVLIGQESTGTTDKVTVYMGVPLVTLVVIRQVITLVDNAKLLQHLTYAQRKLRHQAYHDPLTGLANLTLFRRRLSRVTGGPHEQHRRMALYFIDLDDFKGINDTFGHAIGDRVLLEVSQRLRSAVRAGDVVARLGGDEFGILTLDETGDPSDTGSRMLETIGRPIINDRQPITTSASIGVVVVDVLSPDLSADTLLKYADRAMYASKEEGKARVVTVTPEPTPSQQDHGDVGRGPGAAST